MVSLLFTVLILGVLAWVVVSIPMPQPFRVVAFAIMTIVLISIIANALGYPLLTHPLR